MSGFEIKGWCPGALRPMMSGDGLVVRIRPRLGTLSRDQAVAIAVAAETYGNGLIDMTSRANIQIRGVTHETHSALIDHLMAFGLIDPDIATESRRNIVVTPHRAGTAGRQTETIASGLEALLATGPVLPDKFGFAIDTGPAPLLSSTSADIRLERASDGQLVLRPDGLATGRLVAVDSAAQAAVELADWFVSTGGIEDGRGRMAKHLAAGRKPPAPHDWHTPPARSAEPPSPGASSEGVLVALEFGQLQSSTLAQVAQLTQEIRVTPWRMLLLTGLTSLPDCPGLIAEADDAMLRVTACTGAPGCPQAFAATRMLARTLAPYVQDRSHLHVSGCAKGCAHPAPAPVTVTATPTGYDLIFNGRACDSANLRARSETDLLTDINSFLEGH